MWHHYFSHPGMLSALKACMHFKGSITEFWGLGVVSVPRRAGWRARLLFSSLSRTFSAFLLLHSTCSSLCPSYWFGARWSRVRVLSWEGKTSSEEPGSRKVCSRRKGWSRTPRGWSQRSKGCLGDNLTQTISTSTLSVGFLILKKKFNLSWWFFFHKLSMPSKISKFWTEIIPIFVTVNFRCWIFSYCFPLHTTM